MSQEPYSNIITYHFETAGYAFAVTGWSEDEIVIEETRKNGQEDTHFYGCLNPNGSGTEWYLDSGSVEGSF